MTPFLKVENLNLYYDDAQALYDVSLEVPKGEIVAIVGANGAGKTSLIRAIAGIQPCRSGRVFYQDKEITNRPSSHVCNLGVGQVAEGRQVFPTLSILENLEVGAMLPRARRDAKRTLDEVFAMFPRLAERRAQLAGTLSGGEQQMLAIGRCLMGAPELIMFDEPSLGLAPLVVREIFAILGDLNEKEGLAVLVVEQNAKLALRSSSRAYVLEVGRVALEGPSAELAENESVRKAYLGY
jgi:branched-chain amino acid transport system ATP-binding protein